MELTLEREISPAEWITNSALARARDRISAYLLRLSTQPVGFLTLLAPRKTFFAEFGFCRPFLIAHHNWLASEQYDQAEREMKAIFAPISPNRSKWPQVGEQRVDRLHLALPLHRLDDLLRYFATMATELDSPVSIGTPWAGDEVQTAPEPKWVAIFTEWPTVSAMPLDQRVAMCETVLNDIVRSSEPKQLFPLSMCRAISASLALAPFPPRVQFAPRASDFDDIHLLRAKIVGALETPSLYSAAYAAFHMAIDDSEGLKDGGANLLGEWRRELQRYLERMNARYTFFSQSTPALFT